MRHRKTHRSGTSQQPRKWQSCHLRPARRLGAAGLAAAAIVLSACGSTTSSPTAAPTTTTSGATVSSLAQARAELAPYVGHPSAFPVTAPLSKRPPAGSRFVYLQCSTPVCALIGQLLVAPTKALGVGLTVVNAGGTATSSQSAAAAALADKPAAVLVPAVDPQLFGSSLHSLDSAGIPVVGVGVIGGKPYGVEVSAGGASSVAKAGRLLADWVATTRGSHANVVFVGTPELNFSTPMRTAFDGEMAKVCPSCALSYLGVSVETFGNTAPSAVVSYLEAHPTTKTVVFASMEAATGLAAALKDANLHVTTIGFAPTPSNLQDIKNGGLTAGLGLDLLVQEWVQVDMAARLIAHQQVAPGELNIDLQLLTSNDINSVDIARGWSGYPDVAQRFAQLWSPAG